MRKNFTLLFLFLFTCLSALWAGPVTEDNARRTAEDFFRSLSPSMTRGTVSMRLVYQPTLARSSGGEAEYYVFAPDTLGGFVIVSGDDTLTPIVGYSATEAASGTRIPDALKAWLDDYARYVGDVRGGSAKAYMRDISKLRAAGKAIEPMVTTKWDQGKLYNDLCPVIGNGKTPTGCVATAMAQIMKFHGWPDVGEGSKTYYDNQGEVTLDLSKSVYDWAHMRDEYLKAGVPTILRLPYHCNPEAVLGNHKVEFTYNVGKNSYPLALGEHQSSAYFNVAISTGVEDTPLSGCVLITRPDAFLLKGVVPGSSVHVTALDGRILFEGTAADVEMSLPMSGVSSGLYVVTVKTPDGEMKAMKGRRQ